MAEHEQVKKVPYDEHPDRCTHIIGGQGQCGNLGTGPGANCLAHGGGSTANAKTQKRVRAYKLQVFMADLEDHLGYTDLTGLRDEVALMRLLVETKINDCKDNSDLVMNSAGIADLVMKVQGLVVNCQKLEANLGKHIDATSLLGFAHKVIEIISDVLDDEEKIREIADRLVSEVGNAQSP